MYESTSRVYVPSIKPRQKHLSKTEKINLLRNKILVSIGKLSDKDTTKQGVSELLSLIDQIQNDNIPVLIVCTYLYLFNFI